MTINNIQEAEKALLPYVPLVAQLTGKHATLERIRPLMELLGNPQNRLRVIHVAGTSGKTSTAYYMTALLCAAGQKVGLTVSPHVDSITERVQVGGQPLDEAVFCQELDSFLEIVRLAPQQPSYFELLYAFAIWVFERQGVDYAVIETGMGGLYDATNVVTRPDKVCVITDIGFDHTHILGKTLPEIMTQKIGIVHPGNHLFMYRQADEIMSVAEQWTSRHKAPLHIVDDLKTTPDLAAIPAYQLRNWNLAYQVYNYLSNRDDLQHLTSQVLTKTRKIQIPGRMEVRNIRGKILIMDGAHNSQKMLAFTESFQQLYPGIKPAFMIALKLGKEYREVIPLITPLASQIITTTFNTSQDLPALSMDPEILARAFRESGVTDVQSITDQHDALKTLLAVTAKVYVITGSFYLLSQLRNDQSIQ